MLLYLVLDLSLLRGVCREANLAKLFATVTRTLLSSSPDVSDITFGYTVYDSHVGGYMLSYQLNMVAQGMGIPKNVATTSACDLTRDDLVNFLTLAKLVTDKHVVESLNLRTSRNSRSSDIPAVETCKVLHTVLKTTCVHRLHSSLAGGASDDDAVTTSTQETPGSKYGFLLMMTPSLGSVDVLHGYFGRETMEGCGGDVEKAFLKHLPLSLWKAVDSHQLSCAWVSGNGLDDTVMLEKIEASVREVFPRFALTSLDVVGVDGVEPTGFVERTGFEMPRMTSFWNEMKDQEASSKAGNKNIDRVWAETAPHSSLELLQMSMARVMPRALQMTPLGRSSGRGSGGGRGDKSVKSKGGQSKARSSVAVLGKVGRGVSKKTGAVGVAVQSKRGQKAIRRARMPEGGNLEVKREKRREKEDTPTSTVDGNQDQNADGNVVGNVGNDMGAFVDKVGQVPYVEDLQPCTVEEAGARVAAAVGRIEAQELTKDKTDKVDKDATLRAAYETVPVLTSTIQRAMAEAAKHAADHGKAFDVSSSNACRVAFVEAACTPVKELQQMHRTMPYEKLQTLAWKCAVQLLLRLCIATTSCPLPAGAPPASVVHKVSLSPEAFAAVEDIMHIIVATMSPIPSQGHALFLKVIKPCFVDKIEDDMKNLEKSIWDEEEMIIDEDGALADVRLAAESLEESGETPDESMNSEDAGGNRPAKKPSAKTCMKRKSRKAVSKKLKAIKDANAKETSVQTASAGTHPLPSMSADGSGIHGGGNYVGTAVSGRRGDLPNNLLSRRFNNSAQYTKMVRAAPGKSKMAVTGSTTAKAVVPAAKAAKTTSKQTSDVIMPSGSRRQVPDTPLGKAPGQGAQDVEEHIPNTTTGASCRVVQGVTGLGGHGVHGMTTPDTAMMKKAEDVIPNTSPRGQPPANANQMKRVGSIRQPLFDDASADAIFKASSKDAAKNTWLSGAIVKRRKPAPSGATRMGDMQNVDSTTFARQETEIELHKEIMSPMKPSTRRAEEAKMDKVNVEPARNSDDACDVNDIVSMHTAEQVDAEGYDDIEILLSPGPFAPNTGDEQDGEDEDGTRRAECDNGKGDVHSDRQLGDNVGNISNAHDNAQQHDQQHDDGEEPSSTFDPEVSDDLNSMAAKNDGDASECSSSHLHGGDGNDGVTSPGNKTDNVQKKSPFDTPKELETDADANLPKMADVASPNTVGNDATTAKPRRRRGGRLARMHGVNAANLDPNDPEATPPSRVKNDQRSRTPTRSPITIEDRGSPSKPSPGYCFFSPPPRQVESHGPVDYSSDTDSCMGDTPDVMVAMKPLIQASPDKYDSDEEDAAILNAAANGGLSPVDGDKPAPIQRRVRKRSLAAVGRVTGRVPGEIARRNKAKALAAVAPIIDADADDDVTAEKGAAETPHATHGDEQQLCNQKKLTAPLGQKKRAKIQSVDDILKEPAGKPVQNTNKKSGVHKMTRMPEQGDLVVCFIKQMEAFVRCTIVKEGDVALARRGKGWCLTAGVIPVGGADTNAPDAEGPFTVKLDSTKEILSEDTISSNVSWYRVDPSSPGPTIVQKALPSGATEAHKRAAKARANADMPRQESIPVLRSIENVVPVTVSNARKRRKLQPTNLRYEGKALESAQKIQLQRSPQHGLLVTRVDGADSLNGVKCIQEMAATELFPENDEPRPVDVYDRSLNEEAKRVIARAKALLAADPSNFSPVY